MRINDYSLRVQAVDASARQRVESLLRDIYMELSHDHEHEEGDPDDAATHALQDRLVSLLQGGAPTPAALRDLARSPVLPASYRSDLESLAGRGYRPGALRVVPGGLQLTLEPLAR